MLIEFSVQITVFGDNRFTCDTSEDSGTGCSVDVVGHGFEAALDIQFVTNIVSTDQHVLALTVECVRHVVERVEVGVTEHGS